MFYSCVVLQWDVWGVHSGMHVIYLLSWRILIMVFESWMVWSVVGCGGSWWIVYFIVFFMWTNMECAYCMAIVLICLNVLLIFVTGSFSLVSIFFIDKICEVVLDLATKTMVWATFHPLIVMLLMSNWYFAVCLPMATLSLQYVGLMKYMVRSSVGFFGRWPMHKVS